MVKRAGQPSVNQGLRLKKIYFSECECLWVNKSLMENKTYAHLYMEYLSCHVAYPFWLTSFYLLWFWGRYVHVRGISHPLEMWRALESGPGYLCSSCRVSSWGPQSLRQCPSLLAKVAGGCPPLLVWCFRFIILTKSNIILQDMEIFPTADFFKGFSWVWHVGYLKLYRVPRSMWGTSSYSGVKWVTSDHAGYL